MRSSIHRRRVLTIYDSSYLFQKVLVISLPNTFQTHFVIAVNQTSPVNSIIIMFSDCPIFFFLLTVQSHSFQGEWFDMQMLNEVLIACIN